MKYIMIFAIQSIAQLFLAIYMATKHKDFWAGIIFGIIFIFAVFGFCIRTWYDNDNIICELISRMKHVERELGITYKKKKP